MLTLTQGSTKAYLFTSFLLFIISIILPTGIELGYIKPIPEVYSISETAISVSSGIYVSFNLFLDLSSKSPFTTAGSFIVLIFTLTDAEESKIVVTTAVVSVTFEIYPTSPSS